MRGEKPEGEVLIPATLRRARMHLTIAAAVVASALIFDREASVPVLGFVGVLLAAWLLSVRTTALFVNDTHAGVRYLGGFRRSAERIRITHVAYLQRGSLALGGKRRMPLLLIDTANWTDDQVASFIKEVGEWVFNDSAVPRLSEVIALTRPLAAGLLALGRRSGQCGTWRLMRTFHGWANRSS